MLFSVSNSTILSVLFMSSRLPTILIYNLVWVRFVTQPYERLIFRAVHGG